MGSWVTLKVEVNAADQRHADTQIGYCVKALEALPFVESIIDDIPEYEEDRV